MNDIPILILILAFFLMGVFIGWIGTEQKYENKAKKVLNDKERIEQNS